MIKEEETTPEVVDVEDVIEEETTPEVEEMEEIMSEDSGEAEGITSVEETTPEVTAKTYMGKEVISEGTRMLNGKEYITIRLSDGSTYDLTSEEYELQVIK